PLPPLPHLPYASAGGKLFTSAVDVSGHFSSGSPPNLVRRLLAAGLPLFGLSEPAGAAPRAPPGRAPPPRGPAGPPARHRRHPGRLCPGGEDPAHRRRPLAPPGHLLPRLPAADPLGLLLARGAAARHGRGHPLGPDQPGRGGPVDRPGPPGPGRPPGPAASPQPLRPGVPGLVAGLARATARSPVRRRGTRPAGDGRRAGR